MSNKWPLTILKDVARLGDLGERLFGQKCKLGEEDMWAIVFFVYARVLVFLHVLGSGFSVKKCSFGKKTMRIIFCF